MSTKVPGGHHILASLPRNSVAHAELASLDFICKVVDHGAIVWFILIHLVGSLAAMGAYGTLDGRGSKDA